MVSLVCNLYPMTFYFILETCTRKHFLINSSWELFLSVKEQNVSRLLNTSPPQKKKRERGALRQIYCLFSLHRSNKQQEKDKKFQRIQTEHIKSKLSSCFQLVHCISLVQQVYNYVTLLEHSGSTCAITGQINGSYFTVRPAKFKRLFELKAWVIMIFLLISFSRSVLQVMNLVFSTRYISFINYLELG